MRRSLSCCAAALAAAVLSLGLPAGPALAAAPARAAHAAAPAAKPATKPATKPAPASSAVPGKAHLYLGGAFFVHGAAFTVPGRAVEVQGYVRPYVAGQWVRVRAFLGGRRLKSDRLRVKPAGPGIGAFTERVTSPAAGIVHVTVVHARTAQQRGFTVARAFAVLTPAAGFGSGGQFVALIQQRLAALHFYLPQSGVYDLQTGLALDAYHRLLGHGTSQALDGLTISELLDGVGAFHVRYPRDGIHVEGNLSNQVLALINGHDVYRIYPISSGKPSTPTVLGRFKVYSRVPGYLPDGMYYSDFFYGGYAIHGYSPAPDYPASHGCMRVPISDAISIFDWLKLGDRVDVYR